MNYICKISQHPSGGELVVRGCLGLGGQHPPNFLMFPEQLGEGEAEVWISKMFPSLGVSFKEKKGRSHQWGNCQ